MVGRELVDRELEDDVVLGADDDEVGSELVCEADVEEIDVPVLEAVEL